MSSKMHSDHPLVSVIIPTYGRPVTLADAIASVRAQTYREIEIVIVDDNPPQSAAREATRVLVEGLRGGDIPVVYLGLPHNMGAALGRNEGVHASRGELITFLDDDDTYLPRKIELQVAAMGSDSDICACAMVAIDGGRRADYIRTHPAGSSLTEFLLNGSAFTPMIMVRRELFLRAGGFLDTPRFQDHVLALRLLSKSERIKVISQPLFVHNLHLGDRVSFSKRTREAFLIKHGVERSLQGVLDDNQRKQLAYKQMLDLYECDLFEASGIARLKIILGKLLASDGAREFVSLLIFSVRKSLRRSPLVWKIRRFLFSKKVDMGGVML